MADPAPGTHRGRSGSKAVRGGRFLFWDVIVEGYFGQLYIAIYHASPRV